MADAADDTKLADDSAASDDTLLATPGSGGGGKPVQADATALEIDTSDRYALAEVHAAGGLGRVMRARDRRLHRTVAVKELLQRTPAAEARFVREALITAQLEHPGIVPVHDAGRWPSGEPYYSMKLVSGRTLRDLIQTRKGLDERLALIPNALAVAEAIAYAHSRDDIHRDIKPPNVLVGDFGETLVIDWGLAKDLSGRVAEPAVEAMAATASGSGSLETEVGNVMGTPAYMSPEQARGEEVDARTDVYSLGALLYEVLTGEPPHLGPSLQVVLAHAQEGRVVPVEERQPDAHPDLCAVVRKAMARERADRYPTAMEMAADLRRFQTGQLVTARHYSTSALVRRWVGRHRAIVAVVLVALLLLAAVAVGAFRGVMAQRNRAEREMHAAERARDELIFRQAESLLRRDPTAAIAWLKRYPRDGEQAAQLGAMVDDAIASGVARHVLRHPAWVERLAYTPDGKLVTADRERNLWRWDPATGHGTLIRTHTGESQVLFSPDGTRVAITHADGAVELVPTEGGEPRRLLGLPAVAQMIFSADGGRLLANAGHHMRVWDTATGAELLALEQEVGEFANLAPDGARLFVAREAGDIVEYTIGAAGRPPRTVVHLDSPAVWLLASPDGKKLVAGDNRDDVKLVDLASGKARLLGRHRVPGDGWFAFSHSGDRFALTPEDGTIVVYELASGAPQVLRGHEDPVFSLIFSRDDSLLMSAGDDGTARIWNLAAGEAQVLRGHTDDVCRLALSPDGAWLATASLDGTARVWPVGAGIARVIPGRIKDADDIAFVAGGARLSAGNREREVETFDLASGTSLEIRLEPWPSDAHPQLGGDLLIAADSDGGASLYDLSTGDARPLSRSTSDLVTAVGIASDGTRAVTVARSAGLLLWDVASGESRPVRVERAPEQVQFLPRRREVALGGAGFLELWDLDKGQAVARATLPAGPPTHTPRTIFSSPDGRLIASLGQGGEVVVWDTAATAARVVDQSREVQDIAVSPDGNLVALALGDRTVKLWDATTGTPRIIGGHGDLVHQVAFSPDGRILASCSFDRTIRLWMVDTGRVRVLRGHTTDVKAIAFSADGKTLASIGGNGTVRLWPLAALPDDSPAAVPARLAAATTALVDTDGRPFTPRN